MFDTTYSRFREIKIFSFYMLLYLVIFRHPFLTLIDYKVVPKLFFLNIFPYNQRKFRPEYIYMYIFAARDQYIENLCE